MAKFHIKIEKDDGTLVEDVMAIFTDEAIPAMIGSCEDLKLLDANNDLITGGRAVSVAIRQWLFNHIKEYSKRVASEQAKAQVEQVFKQINDNIVVE